MARTIDEIFKALERLGVRKGSSLFRAEMKPEEPPRPARDGESARRPTPEPQGEDARVLMRARAIARSARAWGGDMFERQARFLEAFEPRQAAYEPCEELPASYDTPYNLLTMGQLKYYFYWRAAFRRGVALPCDGGYAQLFVRETASGIGCETWQRIDQWARLLKSYPDLPRRRRDDIAGAIIDQYAISDDEVDFWTRMEQRELTRRDFGPFYEYDERLLPGSFSYALKKSNYDPRSGKYLRPEDLPRLEKAYDAACEAVFGLMEARKARGSIVLWGRAHKEKDWSPLRIPYSRYAKPKIVREGEVVICATEKYSFKKGESLQYRANPWNVHQAVFLGYLLKRCEARMRVFDKYRYKLNPSAVTLRKDLFQAGLRYKQLSDLLDSGEFDAALDKAVDEALKPPAQRVRVDFSQLEKIRREADIVRAELTVEEAPGEKLTVPAPEVVRPEPAQTEPARPEAPEAVAPAGDSPEARFVSALSPAQRRALTALLRGEDARPHMEGALAEVFWEGVNELALDELGDTVYDGETETIYEDYADALRARLTAIGG